jgi:hypothetical protein
MGLLNRLGAHGASHPKMAVARADVMGAEWLAQCNDALDSPFATETVCIEVAYSRYRSRSLVFIFFFTFLLEKLEIGGGTFPPGTSRY